MAAGAYKHYKVAIMYKLLMAENYIQTLHLNGIILNAYGSNLLSSFVSMYIIIICVPLGALHNITCQMTNVHVTTISYT